MKNYIITTLVALVSYAALSQEPLNINNDIALEGKIIPKNTTHSVGNNGFKFESLTTGINTKYADYGSGLFKNKFISFSARKIGAVSKKDPVTNEPFTKLYCSDILEDHNLTRPLLFSSLLNKNENLGTVSFSEDGNTLYFTKNIEGDTQRFQLYKTIMNPNDFGKWINIEALPFNSATYSVENPHLSKDGRTLYFSSNMPGSKGGFDIFKVAVHKDGSYGEVLPVKGAVNTEKDEKYPHLSVDQKFLFFSSKGHENIGGFDLFKTRRTKKGYVNIVNLGNTINTKKDEVAFIPVNEHIGYITSNRETGYGNYDIYRITEYILPQRVTGKALDFETNLPISGAEIKLIDTDGTQVGSVKTNEKGEYEFPVSPFEYYTISSNKDGFFKGGSVFNTDNKTKLYHANVTLKAEAAPIVETKEKSYIEIKNIFFDYNSSRIKEISTLTLNRVIKTLQNNPKIKVSLNAHTDFRGNDSYNLKLSERRAEAAVKYIVSKGISKHRLLWKGYGETQPLIKCSPCTETQHESNRRIEFIILKK